MSDAGRSSSERDGPGEAGERLVVKKFNYYVAGSAEGGASGGDWWMVVDGVDGFWNSVRMDSSSDLEMQRRKASVKSSRRQATELCLPLRDRGVNAWL